MTVNGEITVNGNPGMNNVISGGGAGGSLLISTFELRGYGSIDANGGRAYNSEFKTNSLFSGIVHCHSNSNYTVSQLGLTLKELIHHYHCAAVVSRA